MGVVVVIIVATLRVYFPDFDDPLFCRLPNKERRTGSARVPPTTH